MKVSAELILEIDRLRANALAAERHLRSIGAVGEASAARMNAGFARGLAVRGGGGGGVFGGGGLRNLMRGAPGRSQLGNEISGLGRSFTMLQSVASPPLAFLTRTLGRVATLGGIATSALGSLVAVDSVQTAAGFQRSTLEISRFAGGLENAKGILEDITALAIRTPFETSTIEEVAKGLLTAGVEGKRVMEVVRDLAAVASDDETLGRLGGALGVGFASQKFELERVKQFLEAQVNLVPSLGQVLGTDNAGVFDAIREGRVTFDEMTAAIKAMSQAGGQFFGLMEARSQDTLGLWSTLLGNLKLLQREMGKPMLGPLEEVLRSANDTWLPGMLASATALGDQMAGLLAALLAFGEGATTVKWDGMLDDFLTGALTRVTLLADSIRIEVGKAMADALVGPETTYSQFMNNLPGGGALREIFGGTQSTEVEKAERILRRARDEEQAANKRFLLATEPRQPGEGRADFDRRIAARLDDPAQDGPKTAAARAALGALVDAARRREESPYVPGGEQSALERIITAHGRFGSEYPPRDPNQDVDSVWLRFEERLRVNLEKLTEAGQEIIRSRRAARGEPEDPPQAIPAPFIPDEDPAADPSASLGAGADNAARGRFGVPGDIAQTINRITRRSTGELVFQEARTQSALLDRVARTMERIEKKMDQPVAIPVTAPGRFAERTI